MTRQWMVAAALATLVMGGGALAQSPLYESERQRGVGGNEWWRSQDTDSPAADIRAVPSARERATVARHRYYQAQRTLDQVIRDARRRFENSADMKSAAAAERQAHQDYETTRREALQRLDSDPDHRAAMELRDQMSAYIAAERHMGKPDTMRIAALARTKLDFASRAREREERILREDEKVKEARARLVEAAGRASAMRSRFEAELVDDDRLVAARKLIDESRIEHLAAASYLDGVLEARDIALDHVEFRYLNDPRRHYGGGYYVSYPRKWWH